MFASAHVSCTHDVPSADFTYPLLQVNPVVISLSLHCVVAQRYWEHTVVTAVAFAGTDTVVKFEQRVAGSHGDVPAGHVACACCTPPINSIDPIATKARRKRR